MDVKILNKWIELYSEDKYLNKCLSDEYVINSWKEGSKNFKNVKNNLSLILNKHFNNSNFILNKLVNDFDFLKMIIKSGTLGVIRGKIFSDYIYNILCAKYKINQNVEIKREFKINHNINEISDFYICNKKNGKEIIIMAQIDLWTGGQQLNRLSKYVNLSLKIKKENSKRNLFCVVAKKYIFKNLKTKTSKFLAEGIENKVIFYPRILIEEIDLFLFC